jgi:hypothetical protein
MPPAKRQNLKLVANATTDDLNYNYGSRAKVFRDLLLEEFQVDTELGVEAQSATSGSQYSTADLFRWGSAALLQLFTFAHA